MACEEVRLKVTAEKIFVDFRLLEGLPCVCVLGIPYLKMIGGSVDMNQELLLKGGAKRFGGSMDVERGLFSFKWIFEFAN